MDFERKLEILKTLVSDGLSFPRNRVYRDDKMLIATDGRRVLALRLSDEELDMPELQEWPTLDEGAKEARKATSPQKRALEPKARKSTPDLIREWLTREAEARAVNLTSLLTFLRADEYLHCPYCSGSGRRPVAEPNDEDGWIEDPFEKTRIVDLGGALIWATLLLKALAHLPASESVTLSTWSAAGYARDGDAECHMLRIIGDGWTLIQMGMTPTKGQTVDVFPLPEVSR